MRIWTTWWTSATNETGHFTPGPTAFKEQQRMSGDAPERLNEALQRQRALSRWENEGGAVPSSSPAAMHAAEEPPPFPKWMMPNSRHSTFASSRWRTW
jgi:hypothetical protein